MVDRSRDSTRSRVKSLATARINSESCMATGVMPESQPRVEGSECSITKAQRVSRSGLGEGSDIVFPKPSLPAERQLSTPLSTDCVRVDGGTAHVPRWLTATYRGRGPFANDLEILLEIVRRVGSTSIRERLSLPRTARYAYLGSVAFAATVCPRGRIRPRPSNSGALA